jgi:hypothetical protein
MKLFVKGSVLILVLLLSPAIVVAQVDSLGKIDTVYADLARINDYTWSITVSLTNDEDIEGLSIPFKMSAGMNLIVADSAVYTGGRVESFTYKGFRPDTAIQCVTLGMIANLGPTKKYLARGRGRLVTVFVSSLEKKPIEKLIVDTTTTQPNNSLMLIANRVQFGETVDTISLQERNKLEIVPAFVVRYSN